MATVFAPNHCKHTFANFDLGFFPQLSGLDRIRWGKSSLVIFRFAIKELGFSCWLTGDFLVSIYSIKHLLDNLV